jgi:hypothetical protein
MHLRNAAPMEVFQQLETQSGQGIDFDLNMARREGDRTVTVDVERQPFWPVTQDVCRQLGLRISEQRLGHGSRLRFDATSTQNPAALPQCYNQGVLFTATRAVRHHEIEYRVGQTAQTQYNVSISMLVDPKIQVFRGPESFLQLTEANDELGHSLIEAKDPGAYAIRGQSGHPWQWDSNLALAYRPDQGKMLKSVKGVAQFEVVRATQTWTCDLSQKLPQTKKVGPVTYTVKACSTEDRYYRFELAIDFPPGNSDQFLHDLDFSQCVSMVDVVDSQGIEYNSGGGGSGGSEHHRDFSINFETYNSPKPPGPPAKLTWEIPTKLETLHVPFEFHDLPIP